MFYLGELGLEIVKDLGENRFFLIFFFTVGQHVKHLVSQMFYFITM